MISKLIAQTNIPLYPTTATGLMRNANSFTLGDIINGILPYVFVIAGLSLLVMLIWGGITLMTAAGDPAKSKAGYGKLTAGLIGFLIIFIAYFVTQIVSTVFGVTIF